MARRQSSLGGLDYTHSFVDLDIVVWLFRGSLCVLRAIETESLISEGDIVETTVVRLV